MYDANSGQMEWIEPEMSSLLLLRDALDIEDLQGGFGGGSVAAWCNISNRSVGLELDMELVNPMPVTAKSNASNTFADAASRSFGPSCIININTDIPAT